MIAAGETGADQEALFLSAFDCLAKDQQCVGVAKELLSDANKERQTVEQGMAAGKKAAQVYEEGAYSDWHYRK